VTIEVLVKMVVVHPADAEVDEVVRQTGLQMEATAKQKVERMERTGRTTSPQRLTLPSDPTSK
jgi:hypothetical protein